MNTKDINQIMSKIKDKADRQSKDYFGQLFNAHGNNMKVSVQSGGKIHTGYITHLSVKSVTIRTHRTGEVISVPVSTIESMTLVA